MKLLLFHFVGKKQGFVDRNLRWRLPVSKLQSMLKEKTNKFPLVLEAFVWIFYVAFYKYGYYLRVARLPNKEYDSFPHLTLMLYAIAMTTYIIPFYRYLAPLLLQRRQYALMFLVTLL